MNQLQLHPVNPQVCRVTSSAGVHVGNLKLIGGVWKFKAVGVDADGHVVPGGGPLTDRHNTVFAALDEAVVSAALARDKAQLTVIPAKAGIQSPVVEGQVTPGSPPARG
jgi:hypothetical protein